MNSVPELKARIWNGATPAEAFSATTRDPSEPGYDQLIDELRHRLNGDALPPEIAREIEQNTRAFEDAMAKEAATWDELDPLPRPEENHAMMTLQASPHALEGSAPNSIEAFDWAVAADGWDADMALTAVDIDIAAPNFAEFAAHVTERGADGNLLPGRMSVNALAPLIGMARSTLKGRIKKWREAQSSKDQARRDVEEARTRSTVPARSDTAGGVVPAPTLPDDAPEVASGEPEADQEAAIKKAFGLDAPWRHGVPDWAGQVRENQRIVQRADQKAVLEGSADNDLSRPSWPVYNAVMQERDQFEAQVYALEKRNSALVHERDRLRDLVITMEVWTTRAQQGDSHSMAIGAVAALVGECLGIDH